MADTFITVIVPVYNSERTLSKCIHSVLEQSYKDFEFIIVDNNSNDATKQIIDSFGDRRIRYVFERKKGRGSARNAGIRNAQGSIIAMTDADCTVPKNWLEELTRPIRDGKEDVTMGFEEDPIQNYWTRNIQQGNKELVINNLNGNYVGHLDTKNFAIRTRVMKKYYFDASLITLEDFDLFVRLQELIYFMPQITVTHMHKQTGYELFKMQLERGYCCKKVFEKHKKSAKTPTLFPTLSVWGYLTRALRTIGRHVTQPQRFPFLIVSELGWRVGLYKGRIR